MNEDTSDLIDTDAIMEAQVTAFMVSIANAFYRMDVATRITVLDAVVTVVEAMDSFPRELEPELIHSKESGRLCVTFNADPCRDPVVVEMPQSGAN